MDYREANRGYITPSKLKLFIDSPLLYKAIYVDEVDISMLKKSPALELWTMVDKYILTPEEFRKEYAFQVWGLKADLVKYCEIRWIELTGKEKVDDLKELIYKDKTVLTQWQEDAVLGIASELAYQPLFDIKWDYVHQKDLFGEYNWLKIKWTLDRFQIDEWWDKVTIRDLKTTSQMYYNWYMDNTQFYADLSTKDTFHYKLQMAMYVWLVHQCYPDVVDIRVIIDAVGTSDPYFYQWIMLDTNELEDIWDTQIVKLLDDLKRMEEWAEIVNEHRNRLCSNRYYRLWTDDCIQENFEYIWWEKEILEKYDEEKQEFDWDSI